MFLLQDLRNLGLRRLDMQDEKKEISRLSAVCKDYSKICADYERELKELRSTVVQMKAVIKEYQREDEKNDSALA